MKQSNIDDRPDVAPASDSDSIDRRGFLECMAWAGTGLLWTCTGGVFSSRTLAATTTALDNGLHFVHISDSHIGFKGGANQDVTGTLRATVDKINALPVAPAFIIHTGDITHDSTDEQFDACANILHSLHTSDIYYVPGEHDVVDEGKRYRQRLAKQAKGADWYSFDLKGVHFIGLSNVTNIKNSGLGSLGREQLEWLRKDLQHRKASTPIVVMAHIPLWNLYPDWGWGTEDGAEVLTLLKRFGSVTVLNGHVHQTLQKVEGSVTFHTASSTAFPKGKPGEATGPGALKVEAAQLKKLLGITEVIYKRGEQTLATVEMPLE